MEAHNATTFELTVDGSEALMSEIEGALAELKYEVKDE